MVYVVNRSCCKIMQGGAELLLDPGLYRNVMKRGGVYIIQYFSGMINFKTSGFLVLVSVKTREVNVDEKE